jgi:hypothetical protein
MSVSPNKLLRHFTLRTEPQYKANFSLPLQTAYLQRYKRNFCGEKEAQNTARQIKHLSNEYQSYRTFEQEQARKSQPATASWCRGSYFSYAGSYSFKKARYFNGDLMTLAHFQLLRM